MHDRELDDLRVGADVPSAAAPLGPLWRRVRRGCRGCGGCRVGPALLRAMLRVVLHLPAFRSGLFVAGFARLLRGPCSGTIVAAIVAPLHTLRLGIHRHGAGKRYDRSQDTNAPPKTHCSHAVSPLCSDCSIERWLSKKQTRCAVPIHRAMRDYSSRPRAALLQRRENNFLVVRTTASTRSGPLASDERWSGYRRCSHDVEEGSTMASGKSDEMNLKGALHTCVLRFPTGRVEAGARTKGAD